MLPELAAQIRAWLEHEDYTEGLRLFRARYGDTIRYRTFAMGENHFNRQRMKELLADGLPPVASVPVAVQKEKRKEAPQIAEWRDTIHRCMDERVMLKQRLRELADNQKEERKKAAFRILEITETLDLLFGKLRYFEQYGVVPEEEAIAPDQPQLPREYLNLRTYISKASKKLHPNGCHCSGCEKITEKISAWYLRMKEIETELKR